MRPLHNDPNIAKSNQTLKLLANNKQFWRGGNVSRPALQSITFFIPRQHPADR